MDCRLRYSDSLFDFPMIWLLVDYYWSFVEEINLFKIHSGEIGG